LNNDSEILKLSQLMFAMYVNNLLSYIYLIDYKIELNQSNSFHLFICIL